MNLNENLGVQSYCFRGFKKNEEVAVRVRQCELKAIELCGVHVDFADEKSWDGALEIYKTAGIEVVSVGVQSLNGDAAKEEAYFDFATRAGAKHMSVSFGVNSVPDSFRVAENLAEKYDLRLAIHNHGGYDWLGNSAMLNNVFSKTSERIGLCLDTAWALAAGENPIAMMEKFASRLYGLHIKDFVFNRAGKPEDVVVGTGNLDLKKLVELANQNPAVGYAVLEYEGDVENPVPALQECVQMVRA